LAVLTPDAIPARADGLTAGEGPAPLSDGDRRRLEDAGPVVVKVFVATLRQRYTDESAGELRKFIDPRYLKEHGLQSGAFPIRRVVTGDIHNNNLSDDPSTALVVADTEGGTKECFLFRLTVYEGNVYILPLAPPDGATRAFSPWILRANVSATPGGR
jgi:hypothetical protein